MATLKGYKEKIEELDSKPISNGLKWVYLREHSRQILQQKPSLSDFIPCKDGKPIEKPEHFDMWNEDKHNQIEWHNRCKDYQQALDRVKFSGFERVEIRQSGFMVTDTYIKLLFKDGVCINYDNGKGIETYEDLTEYGLEMIER